MNLRATHYGYAYQDLITGIALVDLMLGTAKKITVDTKGFLADRFDDLTIEYRTGRRLRIQIKHTSQDRELARDSFSGDGRSLRLDLLFGSLLSDLNQHPGTGYRVILRDGKPDQELAAALKPIGPDDDPGDPLPGVTTRRFKFDPEALQQVAPWKGLVTGLTEVQIGTACQHLVVDTSAPASTLDFTRPGPAERALLRRAIEELGAGRTPNTHISPESAALALAHAATAARTLDGNVDREGVLPRVGLTTDFGAVAEGHPIEAGVAVHRAGAIAGVRSHVDAVTPTGGRVVVTGEPGIGKSWLCEQLADTYRDENWIVVRHHCWLGATDIDRDERVLTEVVIGSLLRQLEQIVPEATTNLRPRFAATPEALERAVQACRDMHLQRNVLLIVDGLDHVDRVLGRRTGQRMDPSRVLVDQLAAIQLQPGVCMLIASQPGSHLDNAAPATNEPVRMPHMSWREVRSLARKHHLLDGHTETEPLSEDDERAVVDVVHERSRGNALYATYLCRYATRTSPLDAAGASPVTVNEILHQLNLVPYSASDVDAYYAHLLSGMTPDQEYAVGALALCGFALTADELGEVLPEAKPLLKTALATLAPVLNSQPGLGGLRIHHESFSRHILRDRDDEWVASIRGRVAAWLAARGFFADARAFRHLPYLLGHLGRYDELRELIQPGFVAEGIRAFQPPESLLRVVGAVARESEARLDWPTLITCVETRKSIDTFESEALSDSIIGYADVVVCIVGADVIAERLVYEGRPTFPSRWGLQLCDAVDRAGGAAPWETYMDARESESKRERSTYSSERDGRSLHLAMQRGALRLQNHRGDIHPDLVGSVAENLGLDHDATLEDLVEVFAAGLPAGFMPHVAAAMTDPDKAARVYLTLAHLAAAGTPGLPDPVNLARQAWELSPALDINGYLNHGIPGTEVLKRLETLDLEEDLQSATNAMLDSRAVSYDKVRRWLWLLTLAHAIDRTIPLKCAHRLTGAGFYRAWLRYAVATIGIADDVAAGVITDEAASTAVLVALADLAKDAHPFTGDPRACDLYSIHSLVHEVVEKSLVVVQLSDLDSVLDLLIAISDGTTTTSNFGISDSGPLVTNDLLKVLSRVSDNIGVDAIYALMKIIRSRRRDTNTPYGISADFELATARICIAAGAKEEADECWRRACLLLAGYGGHKDPTISEIIDSVHDIANIDIGTARECLQKLVDLVYLVRQHTDGRDTSHFVNRWWEMAATIDPTAAGIDGADTLLTELGFEDVREYTAHTHLLEGQVTSADPIVMAALRLTVGTSWRDRNADFELLTRLENELGKSPQTDAMLAIVANNVAASYDDQPMLYSDNQPKSVATPEMVDAVVRLGGAAFPTRTPRPEHERKSEWASDPKPDPLDTQKRLVNHQRPVVPQGRMGAVLAAREFETQRYRSDAAPKWDLDAVTGAIGWRVIETTLAGGSEAGIGLIDDVAREVARFSDNELFAALGEGLAARCNSTHDSLKTVASYCLTLAYVRIRGGRGWRTFAGRERVHLWTTARELDSATAERTLAAAVAEAVDSDAQNAYGVTQAVVAAFAATPTGTSDSTAVDCWENAFSVIKSRLPGVAERADHTYRPSPTPEPQDSLDVAIATLALATIARPLRTDLRQTLIATALLATCRPRIGQAALVHVLGAVLDAGRTTWLLKVLSDCLPTGELTDELAALLTRLAEADWLSVRALAGRILYAHGRPVPDPPATEPAPKVLAAFRGLVRERE